MIPPAQPSPHPAATPEAGPAPTLFLVVLGGRIAGAHIELHDVRFVAGTSIDDTLPHLRRQWFGARKGLHLDSWRCASWMAIGWSCGRSPLRAPSGSGS